MRTTTTTTTTSTLNISLFQFGNLRQDIFCVLTLGAGVVYVTSRASLSLEILFIFRT